jgi:hypothetical protein
VRTSQEKFAGYSGAGCEPLRLHTGRVRNKTGHSLRLHTGRVRAKQDIPSGGQYSRVRENQDSLQATHRQGANSLQAALRRGANLPGQGESEGVEFFFSWITFKFARFSWCDT